jgi:hypothetical protein
MIEVEIVEAGFVGGICDEFVQPENIIAGLKKHGILAWGRVKFSPCKEGKSRFSIQGKRIDNKKVKSTRSIGVSKSSLGGNTTTVKISVFSNKGKEYYLHVFPNELKQIQDKIAQYRYDNGL